MTIDIFFEFLLNYLKRVEEVVRQKVEIEKSNSGFNRNSSSPYAYVSFYPHEIDLVVSLESKGEYFEISFELMNQEGQDPELISQFEGALSGIFFEMEDGFNEVVLKISDRLDGISG
jgi:hypothetical protein